MMLTMGQCAGPRHGYLVKVSGKGTDTRCEGIQEKNGYAQQKSGRAECPTVGWTLKQEDLDSRSQVWARGDRS